MPIQSCQECGVTIPDTRARLGYKTCIKCSDKVTTKIRAVTPSLSYRDTSTISLDEIQEQTNQLEDKLDKPIIKSYNG